MSALSIHLDRLCRWLESEGLKPPSRDVRLIEISLINGTSRVRQDELRKPSDYEDRFEEILRAGFPWLNLSCYGVHEGSLIVAVEIPGHKSPNPGYATPVNLSGPTRIVLQHEWRVDSVLAIV
jgi:hypothetical protein